MPSLLRLNDTTEPSERLKTKVAPSLRTLSSRVSLQPLPKPRLVVTELLYESVKFDRGIPTSYRNCPLQAPLPLSKSTISGLEQGLTGLAESIGIGSLDKVELNAGGASSVTLRRESSALLSGPWGVREVVTFELYANAKTTSESDVRNSSAICIGPILVGHHDDYGKTFK